LSKHCPRPIGAPNPWPRMIRILKTARNWAPRTGRHQKRMLEIGSRAGANRQIGWALQWFPWCKAPSVAVCGVFLGSLITHQQRGLAGVEASRIGIFGRNTGMSFCFLMHVYTTIEMCVETTPAVSKQANQSDLLMTLSLSSVSWRQQSKKCVGSRMTAVNSVYYR
jgi:hypothetical protein